MLQAMSVVVFFTMIPGVMLALFARVAMGAPRTVAFGIVPLSSIGHLIALWVCFWLKLPSWVYILLGGVNGFAATWFSFELFTRRRA